MNPMTVHPAIALVEIRDRTGEADSRRCSGRVDRAIRAAQTARLALERAGL